MRPSLRVLLFLVPYFCACTERPAPSAVRSTRSTTQVTPTATPTALAWLETLLPRVSYRRSEEMVWQDAGRGLSLFAYDAVQTHDGATAQIALQNGSELQLTANTLVIINPSGLRARVTRDKAVVRAGQLKGRTSHELWVLTSGAVIRLRAKAENQPAQMEMEVTEGKQVTVKLTEGEAILSRPVSIANETKVERVALLPEKPITIEAPAAVENFGLNESTADWLKAEEEAEETPAPPSIAVSEALTPTPRVPAANVVFPSSAPLPPPPIDLVLDSPKSHSEIRSETVEVRGRLTGGRGKLMINDKKVALNPNLSFAQAIPVTPGVNTILVQLIRPDGTSLFRRLTVMRRENGP